MHAPIPNPGAATPVAPVRVLIVDDEPAHVEAIRRALEDAATPMEVAVAGSLRELQEAVARGIPHLVLLDLLLPDGRADTALVSPPEAGPYPMVVMTSHGDEKVAVSAIRQGALDYVVKSPSAFADMPRTVERALREWRVLQESRQAREALRESRERLQMALDAARMGVWEYDFRSQRLQWSPEIFECLGLPPMEPSRERMLSFIHPDDVHVSQEAMDRAVNGHGLYHCEYRVVVNGRTLWIDDRAKVIRDEQGRPLRAVGTAQNITDRKQLESLLQQAQKLEAIGQLAGGVAHDFNNILGAILMQLGLISMEPGVDPQFGRALDELTAEAQRAVSLTRQLLMFSRRSVMEIKPVDLNETMGSLLKMLGRLIGEQVTLVFDAQSGYLPPVSGDAGMLEQVVMNLVVNARDAMPDGGRIHICTRVRVLGEEEAKVDPRRQEGRFVCLSVADTGVGMDAHTLKRIFEPFFTTKEPGKGTGLGLATVHGIVAQHRGWVEVVSEPGRGTTFHVFLPAAGESAHPGREESRSVPPLRGSGTILFVEDEAGLRLVTGRALRALGYRVYAAENGQQAMLLWREHGQDVDLLFTDMVMPEGMTGLELARNLRDLKPDLQVIISSGYSAEISRAGGVTQERIRYLPKPYPMHALAEMIDACLRRGR